MATFEKPFFDSWRTVIGGAYRLELTDPGRYRIWIRNGDAYVPRGYVMAKGFLAAWRAFERNMKEWNNGYRQGWSHRRNK